MRIRKGSQVEVWTQEAGSPVGAWRGGEVTWGNGHSYTLRWHDGGDVSGRISRKSVRPSPPPAPVPRDLDSGDMVEVFDHDDCLWKCAEVQGAAAASDCHFDVKIVGAAKVLTVPPQRLRVRQVLRNDDVWVALHKDNNPIAVSSALQVQPRAIVGMGVGRGKGGYKPMASGFTPFLHKRSFGTLGSASDTSSHAKRFEDNTKRLKQEPRCGAQVVASNPNVCLSNKQDEMSGEDCDAVGKGINPDGDDDHQQQQEHERMDSREEDDDDDDTDSDSSSDDSSSGSDSDSRTRSIDAGEDCPAAPTARPCNDQKADDQLQPVIKKEEPPVKKEPHCDDIAESREIKSEPLKNQMGTPVKEQIIHRMELEAYTALMKAFHACGDALSWEKEVLLSDLREHLHVSNDEHLQVLNVILNRKRRTGGPP